MKDWTISSEALTGNVQRSGVSRKSKRIEMGGTFTGGDMIFSVVNATADKNRRVSFSEIH